MCPFLQILCASVNLREMSLYGQSQSILASARVVQASGDHQADHAVLGIHGGPGIGGPKRGGPSA